jgi:coenzyme F420 biosynthesis associated uncharacterized protein
MAQPNPLFGPPLRGALVRSALVGGAVAVGWAIARRYADDGDTRLIDWDTATSIAIKVSGADGGIPLLDRARLQDEYEGMVRKIEGPIAEYTGTTLPLGEIDVRVLDRAEWIRANVASFQQMFRPLEEVYTETVGKNGGASFPGMTKLSRTMLSGQVGLLLGFLARKVLGQYDISLLGHEPLQAGKLYFVEPNIRALETTLRVPAADLRKWIALHEATHAHEFEVNPWVRGYLNGQLDAYLRSMAEELTSPAGSMLGGVASRLLVNLRNGHNLIEAIMSPHQRQMLSRLQALMSLAEGYSNHVMNRVGEKLLPAYAETHERVEHRQANRSQIEELFLRLTGLKMKMEQYALGEKFAGAVTDARGVAFLNLAWQAPEWLPTEAEIRDPEGWIARMDAEGGASARGAASQAS